YLAKYDQFGNHDWDAIFGGPGDDSSNAVAVDPSGAVVVGGVFKQQALVEGQLLTSPSGSDQEIFMVNYSCAWAACRTAHFGGRGDDDIRDIAIDSSHHVFLTGAFHDSISFGGGNLAAVGLDDMFLARLDGAGNHVWSTSFGDVNEDYG